MSKHQHIEPTLGRVVELYKDSAEFRRLKPASQRAYAIYLRRLSPLHNRIVTDITRLELVKSWDDVAPHAAANTARVSSRMLEWAKDNDVIRGNVPTIRTPRRPAGKPWEPWTDTEIKTFAAAAETYGSDSGYTCVKDAFTIALATGQRFGDICTMFTDGWDGEFYKFTQQKTGTLVTFKPADEFKFLLERAARIGERYVLSMPPPNHGREARLRYHFDAVRETTGISKTFHGLRKTVAVKLREAGASDAQIAALLGHRSTQMVERYARGANQVSLATAAAGMLSGLYSGK